MEFSASRVEIQENRVALRCLYGSLLKHTKTRAKRVEMSTSPTQEMRWTQVGDMIFADCDICWSINFSQVTNKQRSSSTELTASRQIADLDNLSHTLFNCAFVAHDSTLAKLLGSVLIHILCQHGVDSWKIERVQEGLQGFLFVMHTLHAFGECLFHDTNNGNRWCQSFVKPMLSNSIATIAIAMSILAIHKNYPRHHAKQQPIPDSWRLAANSLTVQTPKQVGVLAWYTWKISQ